jgi:2-methylcitrate dehydratase PrpD
MGSIEILAEYVDRSRFDAFPTNVVQAAKSFILNSVGTAVGGYKTQRGKFAVDLVKYLGGRPESTLLGSGDKVSCVLAAYANSVMQNALDYDDVTLAPRGVTGHSGPLVPSGLAVAESIKASGKDLITSTILAVEVATRIGSAMEVPFAHGSGPWLTFGVAASASKLLSLDKSQIANALGVAGATAPAPSLKAQHGSDIKNNYGWAAEIGIVAALLAKKGFRGPDSDVLDSDSGFPRMYGAVKCDCESITSGLGKDYNLLSAIAYKYIPAEALINPPVTAAFDAMDKHPIDGDEVEKILVKTVSTVVSGRMAEKYQPRDGDEAPFLTRYCIGAAVSGIKPAHWTSEESVRNPRILNLAKKVELIQDPEAEEIYKTQRRVTATVEIVMADGKKYAANVQYPKGSLKNPMSPEEIRDKFIGLTEGVIGLKKAQEAGSLIESLQDVSNVSDITALLSS